jgi:glycosyltransferase involved in cell wall biosynthesis
MDSEEVINLQNVWIVMPAFNAANTLEKTYFDIPLRMRRNVLLVDDGSNDETVFIAKTLGLIVI